ncbi:hypothetical protein ACULNC_02350 [Shigella flexneri]
MTLKKSDYLPSDITRQVQQSVLDAFNGTDGGLRARVASVVSAGATMPAFTKPIRNILIFWALL